MIRDRKLKVDFADVIRFWLIQIFVFFLFRLFECYWLTLKLGYTDVVSFQLKGFVYDIYTLTALSGLLALLYISGSYANIKRLSWLVHVFAVLFMFIQFGLQQYFLTTSLLLDQALFSYSFDEVVYTAKASSDMQIIPWLFFAGLMIVYFILFNRLGKIKFNRVLVIALLACFVLSMPFARQVRTLEKHYESSFNYAQTNNKFNYLVYRSLKSSGNKRNIRNIEGDLSFIQEYQQLNSHFEYDSEKYPLVHKNEYEDVLGPFFNSQEEKPNIVLVIVESLGRSVSGEGAEMGSFTPFLDSLSNHSLCWEHCLSASERTFGVLPTLLASLPYGEKGFLELGNEMPKHQSMLRILNKNNYESNFFYGGWTHFDKMDVFLRKQNVTHIFGEHDFTSAYEKMPANNDGFSWGYDDKSLYNRSFELLDSEVRTSNPRFDIYLTLTSHSPFRMKNQEKYIRQAENLIQKNSNTEKEKQRLGKISYMLGSFLYADEALKEFIGKYKSRKEFQNTIFIITGDHRLGITAQNPLSIYHVPLIIYSPLLKEARKSNTIVSHHDIAPSILSFLENNYGIKQPARSHWMGKGLDTSKVFNGSASIPLMLNNKEIDEYVDGTYFIKDESLFEIQPGMELQKLENDTVFERIKRKRDLFQKLNYLTCYHNKISPIDLFMGDRRTLKSLFKYSNNFDVNNRKKNKNMDMSVQESFSGKKSMHINPEKEYCNITQVKFPESIKGIQAEVDFQIFSKDVQKNPVLVFDFFDKNNDKVLWFPIRPKAKSGGNWNTFFYSDKIIVPKADQEISSVKIYFWNQQKSDVFIDDLGIRFFTSDK